MAIAITNIAAATSFSDTGATSYATASWTPVANRLYLASVTTRTGITVDPTVPTASGNGLTWVQVATALYDDTSSSRRRVTLFRALGASPTTGSLTFDEAGQSQTNACWAVDEVTGMDTTGTNGSGAIVQSVPGVDVSGLASSLTITLAAFSSVNNATYGAFGYVTAGGTITVGSGFTLLGDTFGGGSMRSTTEWKTANDTTVDLTIDGPQQIGGIAVEIKQAVVGGVVNSGFLQLMRP
jgi:hypothetical protein